MARSRKPLRAFYLFYVPRRTPFARHRPEPGLLGPIDARTKREAMTAFQKTLNATLKAKCLFVDITEQPPVFLSDYELACLAENTLTHLHEDNLFPERLCGGRTRFQEFYFYPETERVHLGSLADTSVTAPGAGLIKSVDLRKAKLTHLSEKPQNTATSPGDYIFHLHNGHTIIAA